MEERFNADSFIAYACKEKNITKNDFNMAPILVTSWHNGFIDSFTKKINGSKSEHWIFDAFPLFTGEINDQKVSVIPARVGASTMVMHLEELVASGAKTIIGVGFAGSLQESNPIGSIIIPTYGISEEGTSKHYWKGKINSDLQISEILKKHCLTAGLTVATGPFWTTDAPYRELISKINKYRSQGVLGVDMETSAMYAFGKFKNIRICNICVVTDELWTKWNPAFNHPKVTEGLNKLIEVVYDTIPEL